MVARNRLDFSYDSLDADYAAPEIRTYAADARKGQKTPSGKGDQCNNLPSFLHL